MAADSVIVRGDRIRALRKSWNLTLEQLAAQVTQVSLVPLSRSYLNDIELGRRNPRKHMVTQLAWVLHVPVSELILDSDSPTD